MGSLPERGSQFWGVPGITLDLMAATLLFNFYVTNAGNYWHWLSEQDYVFGGTATWRSLCHTVSRYQSQWVLCVSPMLASLDWLQFCFVFVCLLELVLAVGGWDGSGGSVRSACMHHVPTCHKYGRTELCGFNSGTPPVRRITNDQECKVLNTSTVRVRNIRAWHPCETVSATKWRNAFAVLSRATFAILQVQSWRDPQPDALTPITGICRGQEGQRGKRFAFVNGDKIYTYPN